MPRDPIGRVVQVADRGNLLVKFSGNVRIAQGGQYVKPPFVRVGSPVSDGRRQRIGRVTDVIGPVDAPYLIVQPARGARVQRLEGQELFTP